MAVVGSVRRLGALAAGGGIAIGAIPGTNRLGRGGLAAGWMGGQRRPACPPRGRGRGAGLGVFHGQAEGNADEGPEQCAHDYQE
jgi:hypothetical protein